jgi:ABC-type glycerol-3-phosphate transport system permease component
LWHALKDVPADRFSAARIDGCTALGIYWYVVLPLVRRTLVLLAILILIAIGGFLLAASSRIFQLSSQRPDFVLLVGVSLAASLPLIVLFLLAKKIFPARRSR